MSPVALTPIAHDRGHAELAVTRGGGVGQSLIDAEGTALIGLIGPHHIRNAAVRVKRRLNILGRIIQYGLEHGHSVVQVRRHRGELGLIERDGRVIGDRAHVVFGQYRHVRSFRFFRAIAPL